MASNEYDDLLESFMNNSAKVYNEDKDSHNNEEKIPTSYNVSSPNKNDSQKIKRGRLIEKEEASKRKKKGKKPYKEKTKKQKTVSTVLKVILGFIMVCAVVGIVCFSVITIYGYSVVYGDKVFDLDEEKYSQNQTSFIYGYDDDGKEVELTRLHGEENRVWVNLDDMSKYMADAFVSTEDKRFYQHHGVDWIRTIGVFVKNNNQGGSTITQQLIKNLTDENDVTYVRKFNEILYALNIERNYSKKEIVEAYLNTIYLSEGCYGVKTASEKYFGKDVKELNAAECATIASITQFPTYYDPIQNPDNNKTRKELILKNMHAQGYITDDEYQEALDYDIVLTTDKDYKGSKVEKENSTGEKSDVNSYYIDYVISSVLEDLQKMGYTEKKAKSLLYGGGLKIYSAVDFDVQNAMEDVYENYRKMPDESVQGAMVVMNYEGRVLGIIGGTGTSAKKAQLTLNRATSSKRQPGSTIKPLSVYGPALEKSLNDDSVDIYWNTEIPDKPLMKIDGKWWPTNSGSYSGKNVTIQYGLSRSMNTISAQTLKKIGVDYSFNYITEKFHISTLDSVIDDDYAPMATGSLTNGVTVLEMTSAYASFGNGGQYYYPYSYYKIEDSQGNTIIENDPDSTKEASLTEGTAWLMNKLLQTVMTEGTGTTYRLSNTECFGKTGTTTEDKDRWFIGGTPEYIAGVWYGYDKPKEIYYRLSPNPSGTIWNTVMKKIYDKKGTNTKSFPEYKGIVKKGSAWYDVNNMPSASMYSSEETTSKSYKSSTSTTSDETTAENSTSADATNSEE